MRATEHARYCKSIAESLLEELQEMPVFSETLNHKGEKTLVYCHPSDANKRILEKFEYNWREL